MAEILVLGVVLIVLAIGILSAIRGREEDARKRADLPPEVTVITADLGQASTVYPQWTLCDPDLGLCGAPDLLQERDGVLEVVEEKTITTGQPPRGLREGDRMQLASYLLLCERDPSVGRSARGLLRYIDPEGVPFPGAEFRLELTGRLRNEVIQTVRAIREALAPGAEVHRNHRQAGRCAHCDQDLRMICGESLV